MRIAAGCIALLLAVILLGGAGMDWLDDVNNSSERIRADSSALSIGDYAALNRDLAESESRKNSEAVRAVAGATFLVAGLFIFGTREKLPHKVTVHGWSPLAHCGGSLL
jgi:hypothetical protein